MMIQVLFGYTSTSAAVTILFVCRVKTQYHGTLHEIMWK